VHQPLFPGGEIEFRFVALIRDPQTLRLSVQVIQCTGAPFTQCQVVPGWGTKSRPKQAFQPTVSLLDKSPLQDGSQPDWTYAFYEPGLATSAPFSAIVYRARMLGDPISPSLQISGTGDFDPQVCVADYTNSITNFGTYWGDYFGLLGFQRQNGPFNHIAVYSSDNRSGCPNGPVNSASTWQGKHLHVVSSTWTD
jgi:hypothetical protein